MAYIHCHIGKEFVMRIPEKRGTVFPLLLSGLFILGVTACTGFVPAAPTTPTAQSVNSKDAETAPVSTQRPRAIYPEGVDPESIPTPPSELPDPPPTPTPGEKQPTPTLEEIYEEHQNFYTENKNSIRRAKDIRSLTLNGKVVNLPPDVDVAGITVSILCVAGTPCPTDELPFYILRRGDSRADVSEKTGRIALEKVAPGEEGAFDFLREALK
ncbi:MAG: hypothetical protein FJ317_03570 [SAR202 cluster bacterium]|nr:hypothetical protein [SAR202 cluster bacterium]